MFLLEPSASIIFGFSTQILSSFILNSSILCGIIVGIISLFSSIIFMSSLSMKLLKESISESTKLCSSKYFWIRVLPYLYINNHPVKYRFPCSLAFSYDSDYISWLGFKLSQGCICLHYFWQLFRSDMILFKQLCFFLFASLQVLWGQYVLVNLKFLFLHLLLVAVSINLC